MNSRVLVTGGAGFIGSAISSALCKLGHEVIIIDNLSTGSKENIPPGCKFIEMDLSNPQHYDYLPTGNYSAIFHLGAQSSGEASFLNPWKDFMSHAAGTMLLLDFALKNGISRFLYASSMSVYGDPQTLPVSEDHSTAPKSFYAAGKLSAETYIHLYESLGINATIFRMFSVYGPNQNLNNKMQGMISIYLSYILENTPIEVKGALARFRDFIYIDDVVHAWLLAFQCNEAIGKTYNLGSGKKTTVAELLGELRRVAHDPSYPLKLMQGTQGDQFGMFADTKRLEQDLGWKSQTTLCDGVDLMYDYFLSKAKS